MAKIEVETCIAGRGLFATEFIPRSTLIYSESAMLYIRDNQMRFPNLDSGDSLSLAYSILSHPDSSKILNDIKHLHFSSESDIDISPLLDLGFEYCLAVGLISRICHNSIGYSNFPERIPILLHNDYNNEVIERFPESSSTGIFLQTSMINHSCHPTAYRYTVNDDIFIHAAVDIYPGMEITISYIPNDILHECSEVRHEYLLGRDFICSDPKCLNDSRPVRESLALEDLVELRLLEGSENKIREYSRVAQLETLQTRDRLEFFLRLALVDSPKAAEIYKQLYELLVAEFAWFDFTRISVLAELDRLNGTKLASTEAKKIIPSDSILSEHLFKMLYF
jgi:SET domain